MQWKNYCFISLFQNQNCWLESPDSECMRWGWQTKETREQMSRSRTTADQIKPPNKTDKTDKNKNRQADTNRQIKQNRQDKSRTTADQIKPPNKTDKTDTNRNKLWDTAGMSHTSHKRILKHLRLHLTFPTRAHDAAYQAPSGSNLVPDLIKPLPWTQVAPDYIGGTTSTY